MIYPLRSSTAFHFGPFSEKIHIKERGDLSGMKKFNMVIQVLLDSNKKVTSCFHNSGFNRNSRLSKSNIELIEHIVPIPPIQGIDIEMFFGECSSKESLFEAKLLEYDYSTDTKTCIEKSILDLGEINSIKASEIFVNEISHNYERWISLKPKSGLHDDFFISLFYSDKTHNMLFDCVHSASFSSKPHMVQRSPKKIKNIEICTVSFKSREYFKN